VNFGCLTSIKWEKITPSLSRAIVKIKKGNVWRELSPVSVLGNPSVRSKNRNGSQLFLVQCSLFVVSCGYCMACVPEERKPWICAIQQPCSCSRAWNLIIRRQVIDARKAFPVFGSMLLVS
jgi:hypothetical protein